MRKPSLRCDFAAFFNSVVATVWHNIFAGSNFRDFFCFFQRRKKKFPQIKTTPNIFLAKIYSRVNILPLKFATQIQY